MGEILEVLSGIIVLAIILFLVSLFLNKSKTRDPETTYNNDENAKSKSNEKENDLKWTEEKK